MNIPFFFKKYLIEVASDNEVQYDYNCNSYKECYYKIITNDLVLFINGYINNLSHDIELMKIGVNFSFEAELMDKYSHQISILNSILESN